MSDDLFAPEAASTETPDPAPEQGDVLVADEAVVSDDVPVQQDALVEQDVLVDDEILDADEDDEDDEEAPRQESPYDRPGIPF